jgi:hypothetical protein
MRCCQPLPEYLGLQGRWLEVARQEETLRGVENAKAAGHVRLPANAGSLRPPLPSGWTCQQVEPCVNTNGALGPEVRTLA